MIGDWESLNRIRRNQILDRVVSTLAIPWPAPLAIEDTVRAAIDAAAAVFDAMVEDGQELAFDQGHADGYQAGWDAAVDALAQLEERERAS